MFNVPFSIPAVDENGPVFSSGALPDNPALEQTSAIRFAGQPTDAELEAEYQRLYGAKATPAPRLTRCRCWTRRHNEDTAVVIIPGVGKVEARLCIMLGSAPSRTHASDLFYRICKAHEDAYRTGHGTPSYGKAFIELTDREIATLRLAQTMDIPSPRPIRRKVRQINPAAWPKQAV